MLADILFIIVSLVMLYFGASWLVSGAGSLAVKLGITPLVIGLTVVAYGTSTPELIVSVQAAMNNNGDISIGNVVGSNIFNILIILGVSSLITPIQAPDIGITDNLVMVGISILLIPLVKTGFLLNRWEGGLLALLYIIYVYYLLP